MNQNTLKKRYQKEDAEAIRATIQALMQHRQSRKFIWWMLQIGGVGTQPFAVNAIQTAFNCGTLDVGNKFLAEVLDADPDGYLLLMKESADERRTRNAELAGTGDPADGDF